MENAKLKLSGQMKQLPSAIGATSYNQKYNRATGY
jgi:hypothetical protein